MNQDRLLSLKSVAIGVPDVCAATAFYLDIWKLRLAAKVGESVYLHAAGADHHILSIHYQPVPVVLSVTFRAGSTNILDTIFANVSHHGGQAVSARAPTGEPGGGESITIKDPQGRFVQIVANDVRRDPTDASHNDPVQLAHVVLNSTDVPSDVRFYENALRFRLSDRTKVMAFLRIPQPTWGDHHSIAFAEADNNCLNHIAFVVPTLDAVMVGGGRLRDAGFDIVWGPGRHGPGNNAFNYFVGPSGFVIEYTAEVQQVNDEYRMGKPADWIWPPGRLDHWGISSPPSLALKAAQRRISFPNN